MELRAPQLQLPSVAVAGRLADYRPFRPAACGRSSRRSACLGAGPVRIAQAALRSGGEKPPAKPLDRAIRGAVTAPEAPGISARIDFVNHLLPSGSVGGQAGGSPLLQGATGRLWLTGDGRMRLELQSDNGDAQIVSDGKQASIYDATSNTVDPADLPQDKGGTKQQHGGPPSLAQIDKGLANLGKAWTLSGARPGNTAGQPSYTLRIAPKDDGGLLGAAEVAWDAAHGTPLRAAIYAQGQSSPVIEGAEGDEHPPRLIPASDVTLKPPAGAKVVQVDAPAKGGATSHRSGKDVTGAKAVAGKLSFPLSRPPSSPASPAATCASCPSRRTRARWSPTAASSRNRRASSTRPSRSRVRARAARRRTSCRRSMSTEPRARRIATALGTVVTFERAGVSYTVAGSVLPVAAENAARGLK